MPVTVLEKWDSRETTLADQSSIELRYVVGGTDDDAIVAAETLSASPTTYSGLPRESLTFSRIGELEWEATVRYATRQPSEEEASFTFETGGGSAHITQSLATTGVYSAPGVGVPNFQGAIGVTKDSVDGVDIIVPVYKWTETFSFAPAFVTGAYKAAVFFLTGRTNGAPFRGFLADEVLFEGARGSKRGTGNWEITFSFAASPNVTGITVGSITGIAKKGWEYLWVRYADYEDTSAQLLVKRPVAVMIEQVYSAGDFSLLGIGS